MEKKHWSVESHEKHEDRKEKQLVQPAGFRDLILSISWAGQGKTVSRHEKLKVPIAVTFGQGKDSILYGLKSNTAKENKGTSWKNDELDGTESNRDLSNTCVAFRLQDMETGFK